jgi:hypothetical protein
MCLSAWGRSARPQVEALRCHAGQSLTVAGGDRPTSPRSYRVQAHKETHVCPHGEDVHARKWNLYAATQDSRLQWPGGPDIKGTGPLRLALTGFKHIKKHVFVRMGKECTPESWSSTLPRRTVHYSGRWGPDAIGTGPLRLALTGFKHIKKHVFVRMGKKCTPASGSSTLPRRTVP